MIRPVLQQVFNVELSLEFSFSTSVGQTETINLIYETGTSPIGIDDKMLSAAVTALGGNVISSFTVQGTSAVNFDNLDVDGVLFNGAITVSDTINVILTAN